MYKVSLKKIGLLLETISLFLLCITTLIIDTDDYYQTLFIIYFVIMLSVSIGIFYSRKFYIVSAIIHLIVFLSLFYTSEGHIIMALYYIAAVFPFILPSELAFLFNIFMSIYDLFSRKNSPKEGKRINIFPVLITYFVIFIILNITIFYLSYSFDKEIKELNNFESAQICLYGSFSNDGEFEYPDDFAGYYIENHIFYVLVTDEEALNYYSTIMSDYDFVEYKIVKYSYNYLYEHAKEVQLSIRSGGFNIKGAPYGVDIQQNKAYISIACEKSDIFDKIVQSYSSDDSLYFKYIEYK